MFWQGLVFHVRTEVFVNSNENPDFPMSSFKFAMPPEIFLKREGPGACETGVYCRAGNCFIDYMLQGFHEEPLWHERVRFRKSTPEEQGRYKCYEKGDITDPESPMVWQVSRCPTNINALSWKDPVQKLFDETAKLMNDGSNQAGVVRFDVQQPSGSYHTAWVAEIELPNGIRLASILDMKVQIVAMEFNDQPFAFFPDILSLDRIEGANPLGVTYAAGGATVDVMTAGICPAGQGVSCAYTDAPIESKVDPYSFKNSPIIIQCGRPEFMFPPEKGGRKLGTAIEFAFKDPDFKRPIGSCTTNEGQEMGWIDRANTFPKGVTISNTLRSTAGGSVSNGVSFVELRWKPSCEDRSQIGLFEWCFYAMDSSTQQGFVSSTSVPSPYPSRWGKPRDSIQEYVPSCIFVRSLGPEPNPSPVLNTDAGISKVCCGRTAGRDATPFPSCTQAGWPDPDGVKVGNAYVLGCTSTEECNSNFELVVTADSQNDLFNTSIIFFFPGDTIDVNRAFLYPRKSSDFGRFSDYGCAVSVGSDIFFANNFFFSLDNPDKTAGNTIFSYNVVTEMFTYDKYKFAYPRDQTVCQSSGYSAYFAGGIKVASPAVKAQTGRSYDVNDEVDQLQIIPSLIPGQENTFKFHYAKYKLSKGRSYLASASVGQVIAFAGGLDLYGTNAVYDNFDVLNVTSGKMSTFKMPTGRFLHACSGVVNLIVCAGGQNDKFGYIRSVDIYDTSLRNFTSIPNGLSFARGLLASGSSNTSVFFAGGFGDAGVPLANVDMFDFGTRTMRTVTPLREPRYLLRGLSQVAGMAVFSGGRRPNGPEPLASDIIEIYDGKNGTCVSDANLKMTKPRFYHFAGVANGIGVFGFGLPTDYGFASVDQWLQAEAIKSVDVVDLGPLNRNMRAELRSVDSGVQTVQLPYYHGGTRIFLDIPLHETRFDDSLGSTDSWTITCLPGFRKSQYQVMKETTLYAAFLCVCTNVTNFFMNSALFPSDQAVCDLADMSLKNSH